MTAALLRRTVLIATTLRAKLKRAGYRDLAARLESVADAARYTPPSDGAEAVNDPGHTDVRERMTTDANEMLAIARAIELLRPDQCPSREHDAYVWCALTPALVMPALRAAPAGSTYRNIAPDHTSTPELRAAAASALRARAQEIAHAAE